MAQASAFSNFFNQPFGLNVRVQRKEVGDAQGFAGRSGVFEPLFNFLEENEKVFKGDVQKEIAKYNVACFNIGTRLQAEETKTLGAPPAFDCNF